VETDGAGEEMRDPIEEMAKAAWNATSDEFNQWDDTDAEEKIHAMDGMRAALLALDGCEDELNFDAKLISGPVAMRVNHRDRIEVFRAMLRSIAAIAVSR